MPKSDVHRVRPAGLTMAQRGRIEDAARRAQRSLDGAAHLVAMASKDRPAFDRLARWIVGSCKRGDEERIADELSALGVECWCPMEKKKTRPRRGKKPVEFLRPLFRGYVFVRVIPDAEGCAGVLCASRISALIGHEGKPALMPEHVMKALRLGAAKYMNDKEKAAEVSQWEGRRVLIREGAFSGFMADVRRVLGRDARVGVEFEIFGRKTLVEVDVDSLELQT